MRRRNNVLRAERELSATIGDSLRPTLNLTMTHARKSRSLPALAHNKLSGALPQNLPSLLITFRHRTARGGSRVYPCRLARVCVLTMMALRVARRAHHTGTLVGPRSLFDARSTARLVGINTKNVRSRCEVSAYIDSGTPATSRGEVVDCVRLPGESWKGDPVKGESECAPKGIATSERERKRKRGREREEGREGTQRERRRGGRERAREEGAHLTRRLKILFVEKVG